MTSSTLPDYAPGRTPHEYTRLVLQARILRPYTERFFSAAGITSGMRVLDIGSGMGDVAMLAGDIVGPSGRVLGIDMDEAVLDNARQRAADHGCSAWVTFEQASITELDSTGEFDALVGRYILIYLPDASATIRHLLRNVKSGGIVVFHDMDLSDQNRSEPRCTLIDQSSQLIRDVFERVGTPLNVGRRLANIFLRAGLPFPSMAMEAPVGGGPDSDLFRWLAHTVISVAPLVAKVGMVLPPELAPLETLASRMEEQAVSNGAQFMAHYQFGAWTRKP